MPLYDFKCEKCKHIFEEYSKIADKDEVRCTECGGPTKTIIAPRKVILFRTGWYEHIDKDPMYITSKKQLKEECRKRGLTSTYAEEW